MKLFVTFISVASFLWWAELAIEWWLASRSGQDLGDVPALPTDVSLSVIVPARNEGKNIEKALRSLLAALPDGGEVILINDRSTDDTGQIARRFQCSDARLKIIDIKDLPDGWLGKTHAMQTGYQLSVGDYLLFTDADVVFKPGCLERAVAMCERDRIDHLVATPHMVTRGFWERVFVSFFSILLVSRYRIWRAAIPGSRFFAGIGAFNLVKRSVYEEAGTHTAIKGEVVDDLLLGRLVKRAGGRQQVVSGERCLEVRWNEGVNGLIKGLEKNAYAGFNYKPLHALAGCVSVFLATVLPALLPFIYLAYPSAVISVPAITTCLGVWLSFAFLYSLALRPDRSSWLFFLTFPLGSVILLWAIVRSVVLYHVRGGVKWRGTVYRKSGR